MKKILIVTDAWAPQINGVVRVQDAHIHSLKARGCDVVIIHPGQFMTIPLLFYPEIRVALFPRRKVAKMIADAEPDAVHIMTEGPLGWAARAVCIRQGIPFTSWYHTHLELYVSIRLRWMLRPIIALLRRFHSSAERTMVSTESLKRELGLMGFRKNIVVVPLGVDIELFKRNPTPSLPPLATPVFVFFSRLDPEKSPEEFLKMELPGTKLVIGDGVDRPRLEKEYGDKNKFVGFKRGQELVDWLSLADVFIFPSRTETFGLVALEALACGIPVAAHDVIGPRDIITNGVDGYIGDDLKDSALKCLALSRDACRATALKYSWEHSADEFLKNLAWI